VMAKIDPKQSLAPVSLPAIERNLQGLVTALFDEIDALRDGTGSRDRVNTVCIVAGRINSLLQTEMKFRKLAGTLDGSNPRLKAITV
jgi:hypothetical protein